MQKGLLHIYTGDGKGKTTAAIGISVRARGSGLNVLFVQFFKEKIADSEISMLESIGVDTVVFESVKSPLFTPGIDRVLLAEETGRALESIRSLNNKKNYDLLVLDEFICLIAEGIVTQEDALIFLKSRPDGQELVLTGSGATEGLMDYADYVTFMKNVKHPFKNKTIARKGIEY
jgi:cob(I)alamin adenosyltransferase